MQLYLVLASYLIPIAILGGVRNLRYQRQKRVRIEAKQASIGRIEDLKAEIGQADRRIKKLESYQVRQEGRLPGVSSANSSPSPISKTLLKLRG